MSRSHWTSVWYHLNLSYRSASPVAAIGPPVALAERRLARRGTAPEVPRRLRLGQLRGVPCPLVWGVARVGSSATRLVKAATRVSFCLSSALSKKGTAAPEEPSDDTAQTLKCSESNASHQKTFDAPVPGSSRTAV